MLNYNIMEDNKTKYPTSWILGKHSGNYRDSGKSIIAKHIGYKTILKTFVYGKNISKSTAILYARSWLLKKSLENKTAKNQIRFLDEHTIEVQITTIGENKLTFITDASFLTEIQKHNLSSKKVREDFHVYSTKKKQQHHSFLFYMTTKALNIMTEIILI